jgi:hypothetical protein
MTFVQVHAVVVVVGVIHEHPVGVQLHVLPSVHAVSHCVDTHAFVVALYIFEFGHVQVLLLYVHQAAIHSSLGTALHCVFDEPIGLHIPTLVSHVSVVRLHIGLHGLNTANEKFVLTKTINNTALIIFFISIFCIRNKSPKLY